MENNDLALFRQSCRDFLQREAKPYLTEWEKNGLISRDFWRHAGKAGLLGLGVARKFGGAQQPDFHYASVLTEELIRAEMTAPVIISHNDVIASYIDSHGTDDQRDRWLPKLCSGELIAAIAVTEPNGGSDSADLETIAVKQGQHYVVNGHKRYITNGINADLILTAVKTSEAQRGQGISLIIIERGTAGFERGPLLKKIGWHASDTADLYFSDCHVPCENLIGRENMGNLYFMGGMPRERLSIATVAVSTAEYLLEKTLEWAKSRKAFGQPVGSFQYNRFDLAELDTEIKIARLYLNDAITKFNQKSLNIVDAARIKLWTTELQIKVADRCLQLHGGAGYMSDSFIGKSWANSRVQTIYGGTSEILKEFISKSMGL
ncbi:Acyl-CoA dehydrogenase [Photorhabdus australis subsp. thailandensis]|uniref:Acyl-CoA dehydrogenase n=1 Tax=Photorhabdus australis subsp. thailandensis TaxID=2805096 RepID=A0A1C0U3J1_9GAMM|nr:acyl-CoA dehydrogenase family protein [Photorhabdus australis]OCQ52509.1 Acyl-CoA dehydrogenase [Photorhabdus australis subsp. thailandensis]